VARPEYLGAPGPYRRLIVRAQAAATTRSGSQSAGGNRVMKETVHVAAMQMDLAWLEPETRSLPPGDEVCLGRNPARLDLRPETTAHLFVLTEPDAGRRRRRRRGCESRDCHSAGLQPKRILERPRCGSLGGESRTLRLGLMSAEGGSARLTLGDVLGGFETRSEPFDLHEIAEAVRALARQLEQAKLPASAFVATSCMSGRR